MKWAYSLFEVVSIPPAQRSVLLALCWDHTDAGGCYPTQARIATLSGYRERKVRDLLKDLEDCGLIVRETRRTRGKFQKTDYALFGVYHRQTGAGGGDASHRHHCAGGDHRQTGAGNRGYNTTGQIVSFPASKIAGGER